MYVELNVIKNSISQIWNSAVTGRQFSIPKRNLYISWVPVNLLYALSPAHELVWLFHTFANYPNSNLSLSTPLFKQMILQIIRGIQKPNTEKFLSRWRALLKTLKVALFVMLSWLNDVCGKKGSMGEYWASQVKPDQVKNILTLKFGCPQAAQTLWEFIGERMYENKQNPS